MPTRPSILVVDEEADGREMLRLALDDGRFEILTAADDRAALTHLRSTGSIACVLADLDGRRGDAIRFRIAQRRDRSLAAIPLVAVSSRPDIHDLGRQLEATRVLAKPFDLDELRSAVQAVADAVVVRRR